MKKNNHLFGVLIAVILATVFLAVTYPGKKDSSFYEFMNNRYLNHFHQ
jgi:hypothetical protein